MAFGTNYATRTPYGTIMIWYGSLDALPKGWHLCDGTGSTPDLRDRFVVGAGNSYPKGAMGGEATHTLIANEIPAHNHGASGAHTHGISAVNNTGSGDLIVNTTSVSNGTYDTSHSLIQPVGDHTHATVGGDGAHENRPPYYALAYIMKI